MIKMTVIRPKPLNIAKMKHDLIDGMRDIGVVIRENFEDTVKTWSNKPSFQPTPVIPKVSMDFISVETSVVDDVYTILNEGSKKNYPIQAVNAKALYYPGTFVAKTSPGIIHSGVGFSGPPMVITNRVIHPGIEARKFDETIKDKQEKNAKVILDRAMSLARKSSGHAYP